jgi:cellulose synthase/poly-beta-1,6-N-acetylglucosamine synthase-like glycosyltransferase
VSIAEGLRLRYIEDEMISGVIPTHNEQKHITACLTSILIAAKYPGPGGQQISVLVVMDDCSDGTGRLVCASEVTTLHGFVPATWSGTCPLKTIAISMVPTSV